MKYFNTFDVLFINYDKYTEFEIWKLNVWEDKQKWEWWGNLKNEEEHKQKSNNFDFLTS